MNDRNTEVLNRYELEVNGIRRGRGAWLCETNQGLMLLKEYKGTVKRLEFEEEVLKEAEQKGFPYVDQYVRNRDNELVSSADDGTRYILKHWYADRECNIKDSGEIKNAVSVIARLHKLFREVEGKDEWNLGSMIAQPQAQEMERHNRELRRARTYIRGKRKKTEFELCVIGNFDLFYAQAADAKIGMEELETQGLAAAAHLCHGELNQHHILSGSGYTAIIEFNKMHLGTQMTDLYHFMRKVMEKHEWDLSVGLEILHDYDKVLPMSQKEKDYLYYLFLYPEKYWKQINFYYNANKAWIPARNIEKLKNLEIQQNNRNHFLENIKN